jgi:hypothetical protein
MQAGEEESATELTVLAVLFAAFRIAAAKKFAPPEPEGYCCSRKNKKNYKKVPTDNDDDESDEEPEAQTKQKQTDTKPKTASLQAVRVLPSPRRYQY